MDALTFSTIPNGTVVVTGKTFPVKEVLKNAGAIWNGNGWHFTQETDIAAIKSRLTSSIEEATAAATAAKKAASAAKKAEAARMASPEGVAARAAAEKERVRAAVANGCSWICCEKCYYINWENEYSHCQVHPVERGAGPCRRGYVGD